MVREHGKSDLSTFEGMELLGMPVLTMVRGRVVVEDGTLRGTQGGAKFVPGDPEATAYAQRGQRIG